MSETETKREKTGGRTKGTPNKRSQEVHNLAAKHNVNPFEILLLFAKGDADALGFNKDKGRKYEDEEGEEIEIKDIFISMDMQLSAAKEACTYLYSKQKAITLNATITDLPDRRFAFPDPKEH